MASGVVAYVTMMGMDVVFSMVEPESYEILAKWLSRTPRASDRHSFAATALGPPCDALLAVNDVHHVPLRPEAFAHTGAILNRGRHLFRCWFIRAHNKGTSQTDGIKFASFALLPSRGRAMVEFVLSAV